MSQLSAPSSEDATNPTKPTGWYRAAEFFVDVIWGNLPPLFVVPTGLLLLLVAKLWRREQERAERTQL